MDGNLEVCASCEQHTCVLYSRFLKEESRVIPKLDMVDLFCLHREAIITTVSTITY